MFRKVLDWTFHNNNNNSNKIIVLHCSRSPRPLLIFPWGFFLIIMIFITFLILHSACSLLEICFRFHLINSHIVLVCIIFNIETNNSPLPFTQFIILELPINQRGLEGRSLRRLRRTHTNTGRKLTERLTRGSNPGPSVRGQC